MWPYLCIKACHMSARALFLDFSFCFVFVLVELNFILCYTECLKCNLNKSRVHKIYIDIFKKNTYYSIVNQIADPNKSNSDPDSILYINNL